jgi:hypothetical protein
MAGFEGFDNNQYIYSSIHDQTMGFIPSSADCNNIGDTVDLGYCTNNASLKSLSDASMQYCIKYELCKNKKLMDKERNVDLKNQANYKRYLDVYADYEVALMNNINIIVGVLFLSAIIVKQYTAI